MRRAKEPMAEVRFVLPKKLLDQLDSKAEEAYRCRSEQIREFIREGLKSRSTK